MKKQIKKNIKSPKTISELRQDIVSGDWVVIATGRAKKPHNFKSKPATFSQPKKSCPFENPQATGHGQPILEYFKSQSSDFPRGNASGNSDDWFLQVIPNKYPAFTTKGVCQIFDKVGPYTMTNGYGFHELFVLRDHNRYSLSLYSKEELAELIRAYHERYIALAQENCIQYITIFHNHGREAGSSLAHPHSQLIAMPVIPPDVAGSLNGSKRHFHETGHCVHCLMIEFEKQDGKRIIFENNNFVVFAPFVSRSAFEMRIFPKKHQSSFAFLTDKEEKLQLAEALRAALVKLYKGINDPAYNFFIHTSPVGSDEFDHYHWHIEIVPKTSIWAGFELGTGIEISAITPEDAAKFLRKVSVK